MLSTCALFMLHIRDKDNVSNWIFYNGKIILAFYFSILKMGNYSINFLREHYLR